MKKLLRRLQTWLSGTPPSPSYERAQERARRGAAYLDDADPGWHARIDTRGLALENGAACVLGQLHGNFRQGLSQAQLVHLGTAPRASISPVHYGFQCMQNVPDEVADRDFHYLNRAWREELRRRQPSSERKRAKDETPLPPETASPRIGRAASPAS